MKTKEINELLDLVGEYKDFMMAPGNDPFGRQNAYWAAGLEYFLQWMLSKKNRRTREEKR